MLYNRPLRDALQSETRWGNELESLKKERNLQTPNGRRCIYRSWRGGVHYNMPFKYKEEREDGLIALWDYPFKADRKEAERD